MISWDWYSATLHGVGQGGIDSVISGLVEGLPFVSVRPGRGMHGYHHGADVVRGERTLARLWWGGNPGVHVQATGDASPEVSAVIRSRWPAHAVSRADACIDWDVQGRFDTLAQALLSYAAVKGIAINQQGDWHRGVSRTLYLGAPSSSVRLVLYEKGHQLGPPASPDWVRLEVRVRPKGAARERVASWEPARAFQASAWVCEALERCGWGALAPDAVGTVWRAGDDLRARRALLRQYGAVLERWSVELGGWSALGPGLAAAMVDAQALQAAPVEL